MKREPDRAGTKFGGAFRELRLHPGTNHQFPVLQVQLGKSIGEPQAIGTRETNAYLSTKRPRWTRYLVGSHCKGTRFEGSGVGEVTTSR